MQLSLEDSTFPLKPAEDASTSLLHLITQLRAGRLVVPLHQRRSDAWDKRKKGSLIRRIQEGRRMVGVIITYQIVNGNGLTFLNDGLQRLIAVLEYFDHPELYGDTKERATVILESYMVTVQHRHYASHDEALVDFQEVNQGSSLTPYEFCHGVLVYMPNYELQWRDLFDELHRVMDVESKKLTAKQRGGRRKQQEHESRRHDLALLYRFATENRDLTRYWTARKQVNTNEVREHDVIEWRMREWCITAGIERSRQVMSLFIAHVQRETALIEDIWREQEPDINKGIAMALYRTLIDVSIWRRNVGKPFTLWEDFVRRMLRNTGGTGSVIDPSNPRRRQRCGNEGLNGLKLFCDIIGSTLYLGAADKKSRSSLIRPGRDESHLMPQSIFGDGPTMPEPAGRNRSRGAAPILQPVLAEQAR